MLTAQQFREKQAKRLKASLDEVRQGVNAVTESPTAKAASKQDKMLANLNESVNSGKWRAGLNRVTTEEWKEKMLVKGVGRIATGIDEAAGKVEDFASQFLPHVEAGRAAVSKLPDLTLEDNIARAETMIRHNAKFRRA